MRILALDYGEKRFGFAICDHPGPVVPYKIYIKSPSTFMDDIAKVVNESGAELLVIGLPLNSDGSTGPAAQKVEKFKESLSRLTDIEIVLWNEFNTSKRARQILAGYGMRGEKRKQQTNKVAAVLILESYVYSNLKSDDEEE